MNFMESVEGSAILLGLKYCERCGGLWLRPQVTDGVYCGSCRAYLAAMPDPGKAPLRNKRRRKPKNRAMKVEAAHIECLQGVASAEVRV
ncbi:MAG: hypothetical protein ABSG02_09585 [Terriglobales bacterium]|jgi:hypothetical protein